MAFVCDLWAQNKTAHVLSFCYCQVNFFFFHYYLLCFYFKGFKTKRYGPFFLTTKKIKMAYQISWKSRLLRIETKWQSHNTLKTKKSIDHRGTVVGHPLLKDAIHLTPSFFTDSFIKSLLNKGKGNFIYPNRQVRIFLVFPLFYSDPYPFSFHLFMMSEPVSTVWRTFSGK